MEKEENFMAEAEQVDYAASYFAETNTRLVDIEEKQKLLKERVLLIGQNLIESKESLEKDLAILKSNVEELKIDTKRIKEIIIRLNEELDKKARKSDLELLQKQARMFQI